MNTWPTRLFSVTNLYLDDKNPRLGREVLNWSPRDLIQYLFEHDKAMDVAESIATRGYFPNEPLLAVREHGRLVVVEGNRRLAALKALRQPDVLEGAHLRQVQRLARRADAASIIRVPVTIAPDRRATDKLVAGRHVGTPVLAWQAENRAAFILEKIENGYTNDELREELGFSAADVQKARQTRAISEMARSLDLPPEVRTKLDNPRAKVFTTIGRVFDSSAGRKYLRVEPSAEHGVRGLTAKSEFLRGFSRLVSDISNGVASSRTLNKNEDIEAYFESWAPEDRPRSKRGSFVPEDIISGGPGASSEQRAARTSPRRTRARSATVVPKSFKVRVGSDRLVEIRGELTRLKREEFPNAGAVLLRVFFELAVLDYLDRTGELAKLTVEMRKKGRLRQGIPVLKDLRTAIIRIAKSELPPADANRVEKAIKVDPASPFGLDDLHSFVHQSRDFPGERDILQFWERTEPLFRMMLEDLAETSGT